MPRETSTFIPRFRLLADKFTEKIRSGRLRPGDMLPSERELALTYDLSRQTIRNAMNILEAEGWVASYPGKGRQVQPRTVESPPEGENRRDCRPGTAQIGMICRASLLSAGSMTGGSLLGFKSALSEHGYTLAISVAAEDAKLRVHPVYPHWLKENTMDGYILASAPPRVQEKIAQQQKPCVSLGYLWTGIGIPSVEMDFREVSRLAVIQLAEKKLFPICTLFPREKNVEERKFADEHRMGHMDAVQALGLTSEQAEFVRFEDSAFDLVAAFRSLFKRKNPPKSIILGSDRFLDEALNYLGRIGILVPQDVTIIALQCTTHQPLSLSGIGYFEGDTFSLARRAGEKLLALLAGDDSGPLHERHVMGRFVFPSPSDHRPKK